MLKHYGREVILMLAVVLAMFACSCPVWADMTMLSDNTTKATANSVWNVGVTWQDGDNAWPLYLLDSDTDNNLQPDPSSTLINQRSYVRARQDLAEIERDIDDVDPRTGFQAPRPGIRLKWNDGKMSDMSSAPWGGDQKDVERVPFPAIGSPEQQALESFLTPSGHIFLGWTEASQEDNVRNGFPIGIATVIEQDPNVTGLQTQVYVRRHFYQYTYADPSVNPPKIYRATIEVPPVIVPLRVPTANLRIFLDEKLTLPYTDFRLTNAQTRYCRRSVEEWDAENQRWQFQEERTSGVAEPLWDMLDIDTTVIVLDPFTDGVDANGEDDWSNPDPTPVLRPYPTGYLWHLPEGIHRGSERIYFTYTIDSSQYVLLPQSPLPAPYTTYRIPALNSLDGSVKLKINKGILGLDPNRTDPNDADPRYPDRPGLNSPILGVYRTPNPGPNDPNLFVPGKYSDAGRYGVIRIESDKLGGTLPDWTDLYVRVSTWGVDAVWTRFDEISDLRFPRRINYFRKPEWMTGVITGTWTGFDPSRPPSPASSTAYTVKPDVDPASVGMRAVTGIFLPQIMSGTVYDRTHVIPADPSKIGMVLGVYALSNQTGTRYDDMHVDPSNPSAITFVSAVYARHTMTGIPIDPKHVEPARPSDIRRVLSVKVPGQAIEYYDPLEHPWKPGDTVITLKDDPNISLPPGTVSVTITYETISLYDSEDPALAYRYNPNEPLSRLITLTSPIPKGSTNLRIVYGMGTGLDGFNYYDSDNPTTVFRPDVETQITLKQPLPVDVTDVRILYATDSVIETRATATDANHVVPPNIWRVGRVHGVYAVLEQEGASVGGGITQQTGYIDTSDPQRRRVIPSQPELIAKVLRVYDSSNRDYYGPVNPANPFRPGDTVIKLDRALPANVNTVTIRYEGLANTVTPSDPTMIRKVLGVYAVNEMTASVVDPTHVAPQSPLSIRSVRGVYATANQPGTADTNDPTRLTAIPSQPAIIGKVNGVYDNPAMTGTNYFDPNNPETTFRSGDSVIKLSTPLPPTVTSLTINYETINLGGSFEPGDSQITLTTPLPVSDPPNDPMPIRVVYVSNLNYYNVRNPIQAYQPGDTQIVLNTPLPLGTLYVTVLYAEAWTRYRFLTPPSSPIPDFVPGHDSITLAVPLGGLPTSSTEAVVEFSGHLFSPSYDPFEYNPDNATTYQYRPFIPGDKIIRLNRLDPSVPLWSKYTSPGALKLCIAYQSNKKVPMGTYTQSGRVELPIPLPIKYNDQGTVTTSPEVYSDFRLLTSVTGPVSGGDSNEPMVVANYTVGIPYRGRVERISFRESEPMPHPLIQISPDGKFSLSSPRGIMSVSVQYRREEPDSPNGVVWLELGGKYKGRIPLYYDRNAPSSGAIYRVAVSAGLNLSNPKQQPSCNLDENDPSNTNRLIFDPRSNPMWYAPSLRAKPCGAPNTLEGVTVIGLGYSGGDWVRYSAKQDMTVHDSRPKLADEMIDHGGRNGNRDYLTCMPRLGDPDPLVTEIAEETNPSRPDDGSSSTQFVFRVRYNNKDGLPPQPWLHPLDDVWNVYDKRPTGVVLYLDEKGIGDYQPHFMAPEDPNKSGAGQIYIYRVIPHHEFVVPADENKEPELYPWPVGLISDNWSYRSLACGVYHYFFACSDDSLKFDDGSFPFQHQGTTADMLEWGEYPYRGGARTWSSSGLDPSLERRVTDLLEVSRPAKRRPSDSVNQLEAYDSTIYVDRPALVPGQFGWGNYGPSASEHPVVTCELRMPALDDLNVPYDDAKYGYGRFFGTLQPYYRATNPAVRNRSERIPNDPIYHGHLTLAETSGATTQTDNVFRILYRQKDNKPPIYIRVYINNASYKSGSGPEYEYKSYT
ncbi:MAG: hypothetical protein N3B12_03720, partial [Armatimonadetes bacterium]|nr:hypothetical protein [Armatimonadota bacterium]